MKNQLQSASAPSMPWVKCWTHKLDSGAYHSIVCSGLLKQIDARGVSVPHSSISITLTGVHGDTTRPPVVNLCSKLLDSEITVPMTISSDIGHDVILGRNCAALFTLMLSAMDEAPHEALSVQAVGESNVNDDLKFNPSTLYRTVRSRLWFPQNELSEPNSEDRDQTAADEDAVIAAYATSPTANQKEGLSTFFDRAGCHPRVPNFFFWSQKKTMSRRQWYPKINCSVFQTHFKKKIPLFQLFFRTR